MQIKNHDDVNNGDIGYIRSISGSGEDTIIQVDFGDGRMKEYEPADLDMLDMPLRYINRRDPNTNP
jgi:exodeoxyribonuclease V alpha subunit